MSLSFFKTKNTERNRTQTNKNRRKMLLIALLLVLFFVGVAVAAIYNSMHMESNVGVDVAFVYGRLLVVILAYF